MERMRPSEFQERTEAALVAALEAIGVGLGARRLDGTSETFIRASVRGTDAEVFIYEDEAGLSGSAEPSGAGRRFDAESDATFMAQAARRLTDAGDGFLASHRILICDRDGKWTEGFRGIVEGAGVRIVLTPTPGPNANAYAERFVRSIREECLDRLILFGERRLLHVLKEFVAHYHGARNHQGLSKI